MIVCFTCNGDHLNLHLPTHSCPTRRSSDLAATSRPVNPVPTCRPRNQSTADTTGLKWAPDTGPNSRISTPSPNTVAVEFSSNCRPVLPGERSEEHTSELQSLLRILYAVFCLKKKKP